MDVAGVHVYTTLGEQIDRTTLVQVGQQEVHALLVDTPAKHNRGYLS